jgi:hypothetical protein
MQRLKKFILLLLIVVVVQNSNAQKPVDSLLLTGKKDTSTNIITYRHLVNLTPAWSLRNFEFQINYADNLKIILRPNEIQQVSLDFAYRFVSLGFSYTPKILNNTNNAQRGETDRTSFNFGFKPGRFEFKFEYAKTTGFYLKNTNDYDTAWAPGKSYIQFPNLTNQQYGFSLSYNFNKKFSTASLTNGVEQQQHSVFSFIPALYAYYYKLYEPDSLGNNTSGDYLRDIDINLILPIAYNWVFDKKQKWNVGAIAGPSIGTDIYTANNLSLSNNQNYKAALLSTGYFARIGIGYTTTKWFWGAEAVYRRYSNTNEAAEKIVKLFYNVQVYAGFRLVPPKFMRRTVDWAKDKSPVKLED